MAKGGKRPGAGRPKGSKESHTIAKDQAREALRVYLTAHLEPVADALVSRAKGVRYFVTRNKKTGKFELVTNPDQVIQALNGEDEQSGEFYTDKPDTAAIREILDRTIDKSKEQDQAIVVSGELTLVTSRLLAARKRLAERDRANRG